MTIITAVKSGNWSDPTVWDSNPALPGAGDVVTPATFAVAIDQDVSVGELNGRTAGHTGYFTVGTAPLTIAANILSGAVNLLRLSHATGLVTITGDVSAQGAHAVTSSGAGAVTINGNITGGTSAACAGYQVPYSAAAGEKLTINGNLIAGATSVAFALWCAGRALEVEIGGNVTAHPTAADGQAANLTSVRSLTVTGNVQGGGNSPGILVSLKTPTTGFVDLRGTVTAGYNVLLGASVSGVQVLTAGVVYARGLLVDSVIGAPAVMGGMLIRGDVAFRGGALMVRVDDSESLYVIKVPLVGPVVGGAL